MANKTTAHKQLSLDFPSCESCGFEHGTRHQPDDCPQEPDEEMTWEEWFSTLSTTTQSA